MASSKRSPFFRKSIDSAFIFSAFFWSASENMKSLFSSSI